MNARRFEELLGQLFDGEMTPAEGDELAAMLRGEPAWRRELQQHLVLWELWAQHQAPGRSAEAFVAACRTRRRAEQEGESFVARLKERMARETTARGEARTADRWPAQTIRARVARGWQALRRPPGLAWAAAAGAFVAVFCWFALPHAAQATTPIHGEAVCTACFLHETLEHDPAIRVRAGDSTQFYYVRSDRRAFLRLGDYCAAPVPLVAIGRTGTKDGRLWFEARTVEADAAISAPTRNENERTLFPF